MLFFSIKIIKKNGTDQNSEYVWGVVTPFNNDWFGHKKSLLLLDKIFIIPQRRTRVAVVA